MKIQLDRRDATVIFLTLLLVLVPLTLAGGYLYSKHQWATDKIAEVTPRHARLAGLLANKDKVIAKIKTTNAKYTL